MATAKKTAAKSTLSKPMEAALATVRNPALQASLRKSVSKPAKKPARVFGADAKGVPGKSAAVLAEKTVANKQTETYAEAVRAIKPAIKPNVVRTTVKAAVKAVKKAAPTTLKYKGHVIHLNRKSSDTTLPVPKIDMKNKLSELTKFLAKLPKGCLWMGEGVNLSIYNKSGAHIACLYVYQ